MELISFYKTLSLNNQMKFVECDWNWWLLSYWKKILSNANKIDISGNKLLKYKSMDKSTDKNEMKGTLKGVKKSIQKEEFWEIQYLASMPYTPFCGNWVDKFCPILVCLDI